MLVGFGRSSSSCIPRRFASTAAASWAQEVSSKPVEKETLAGIPWAGRSTLRTLFMQVALRGPNDPNIWRQMIARADVIAHSLTPKQASLMLSSLVKVQQRPEAFLRRFTVKFAPSLVETGDLADVCGIISSLSMLDSYSEESFQLASKKLAQSAPYLDVKQLTLMANAFVRVSHKDVELFRKLLKQVPRKVAQCGGKDAAVLLNAISKLPGLGLSEEELTPALQALALSLPDLLPKSDLQSLTLTFNAFAQLRFVQKDALDLLTEELLARQERLQNMAPRQLGMLVNAAARLLLVDMRLMELLSGQVQQKAPVLDTQSLCMVANGCARLQFGVPTFQALYAQLPRHISRLSAQQLAMIVHAWAKAHIHNDDLFSLLLLPLAQRCRTFTAREAAITLYAHAHFRKRPSELFNPLLERFVQLLQEGAVEDSELLMAANALGRVGWHNDHIEVALREYKKKEPSLKYLSIQTRATFGFSGEELQQAFDQEGPTLDLPEPEVTPA